MESDSSRLWDILSKASQDVELEEGEIRFAVNSLSGPSIGDRAYACEVLFRAAPSQLMKQQALNTLEELCNTDVEGEHVMTMMTVMLFIPLSALDRPPLRAFAMNAARSKFWGVRTNAVLVLERLAHAQDAEALRLLSDLADDENEHVRSNSRNSLSRLAGEK